LQPVETGIIKKLMEQRVRFIWGMLMLILIGGALFIIDYMFSLQKNVCERKNISNAYLGVRDDVYLKAKT